ncbi:MAG: YdeI/OmpD-associated family protein [Isosphaeraceae bacterium]
MRTAIQLGTRANASGIPAELGEALARYPSARSLFEGLNASDRRTYADFVSAAEDRDGRLQRAEQALTMLAERAAWAGESGENVA